MPAFDRYCLKSRQRSAQTQQSNPNSKVFESKLRTRRDFESMLRIQGRKIVFQQYRPKADSCTAAINVISSAAPSQRSRHIALRTGGAFLLLQTECEPNWQ